MFYSIRLSKAMIQIMSSSTKLSPFDQMEKSTNVPTTSIEFHAPKPTTEQVKIDPFGVSLSNTINSTNAGHINKYKPTFSAVLDPFGSDEIDGTVHNTNKWKKVPEVGSVVNGSLKMTSKNKKKEKKEFGMIKKTFRPINRIRIYLHFVCRSTIEATTNTTSKVLLFILHKI